MLDHTNLPAITDHTSRWSWIDEMDRVDERSDNLRPGNRTPENASLSDILNSVSYDIEALVHWGFIEDYYGEAWEMIAQARVIAQMCSDAQYKETNIVRFGNAKLKEICDTLHYYSPQFTLYGPNPYNASQIGIWLDRTTISDAIDDGSLIFVGAEHGVKQIVVSLSDDDWILNTTSGIMTRYDDTQIIGNGEGVIRIPHPSEYIMVENQACRQTTCWVMRYSTPYLVFQTN